MPVANDGLRARRRIPLRTAKHIKRLGLYDEAQYLAWCEGHRVRADTNKHWQELEAEWQIHCEEFKRVSGRVRVDRDPAKQIALVCAGKRASKDIARPRWRSLAHRIEAARLSRVESAALQRLVEVAARRSRMLLAEVRFAGESHPMLDVLIGLARAHRHWRRSPAEWRPRTHNARRQLASIVRHLLSDYAVPAFLDAAWVRRDAASANYRSWFVAIGRGENIRHCRSPIPLTKRIVHHFMRAPEEYAIEEALRWGQVLALGGSSHLAAAIAGSRIGRRFEHEDFWVSVVRFFVAHPSIEAAQVGPVIDYLHHQRFEAREVFVAEGRRERLPPLQPNLSMTGRDPRTLMRQVEEWHSALARSVSRRVLRWKPSGVGEFELEVGTVGKSLRVWRVRELLTSSELAHEGATLRHCVATYASWCAAGRCSIWTLEVESFAGVSKRLTIELDPNREIVQVRGRCNRLPTQHERGILERWVAREGLSFAGTLEWR